ncbi:unnamed protein product [Rhizoctonia solani]|uniref:Zn(2)-C6 fungal-type domain-containing protein n=1 Tax=Rhizoctonia solani TaxID=456999 RepID=A0A8H3ASX3_9AGAM|nr:unnamed protein product [Rhizoctonia solani]
MINAGSVGCVSCEARNKKCDRTRGPSGCRRCAQAGIECGGYLVTSLRDPRLKHSNRGNEQAVTAPYGRLEHIDTSGMTSTRSSIGRPVPSNTSRSSDNTSANSAINHPESNPISLGWSSSVPAIHQHADYLQIPNGRSLIPRFENITVPLTRRGPIPVVQPPVPLAQDSVDSGGSQIRVGRPMNPDQASLFDAIFSLADDPTSLLCTPEGPRPSTVYDPEARGQGVDTRRRQNSDLQLQAESHIDDINLEDDTDAENLQVGLLSTLPLDKEVESNMVPFISHAFISWMIRFVFEPVRGLSLARHTIIRGHSLGDNVRQRIILVAKTVLDISRSTNYELTHFTPLQDQLVDGVIKARAQDELTKEEALKAMDYCHELLSILTKVASLASVLNTMALCAPIFRRVCPESSEELVNLPGRLIAVEVNLKFYATSDVLQSIITHRPMLFRYDLEFLSPEDEKLLNKIDGPGLRWLYGVPDRLVIVLARINSLLEDYGSCVDPKRVQELEKEIVDCKPIFSSGTWEDPILKIGRAVMQESWRLAAYIYLYMAS